MRFTLASAIVIVVTGGAMAANTSGVNSPTFSKDVAPILYKRCLECHRPGEAGPMAFRTYSEVRPWAKAIKGAVLSRTMPPWFADPKVDHFANDRRLSDDELSTIVKWSDAGAPEGNAADMPKMPDFVQGWVIGKPDMVISTGTAFKIPAEGVVPYQYFKVDPGFKEDTWVQAAEVRPSQRAQVHHILVFVVEGGKRVMKGEGELFQDMLIGYAPGVPSIVWDSNTAFLVKAGSTLMFQVHYTVNGKEAVDESVLGLKIRKDKPELRAVTGSAVQQRLNIPPGEPNYETKGTYAFKRDITMVDMTPHMHLRGKAFKYVLTYPDGHSEEILNVPHYDFNWQLSYILAKPLLIPAGSKLECTAWYDNSANNKYNPDPTQAVHWGDQTFEEMMIGFFNYTIPVDASLPGAPAAPTGF
jgi:Copper type II ascorbate-dependent monooxygenase, C-terminal domain